MIHHEANPTRSEFAKVRARIDQLRAENQGLRMSLVKARTQAQTLDGLLKLVRAYCHQRFTQLTDRLIHMLNRFALHTETTPPAEKDTPDYSPTFQPYQVRIIHQLRTSRPRILHVIGNFYTGGSARLVVDLIEHLGHRYDQTIITRDAPPREAYTGLALEHHCWFKDAAHALSVLERIQPNLVHVHYLGTHENEYSELDWLWYNHIFQAAEQRGCRVVENINIPTDPYESPSVNCYVYVSNYVQREFGSLDAPNLTIYPGSDLALFSRKSNSVPDDCIGMCYRLEDDKLNLHSLDVFLNVLRRRPGTKALIIGGGTNLDAYKSKVEQAGLGAAFHFTGYVSYHELPALFEQMSLFVAPVHTESFGQVSAFAMGMQLPVVGYDVGALKEIVETSDLLAPAEDSDALARIVLSLLNEPEKRLQLGLSNRARAERLFSVEAMATSYRLLYENVLGEVANQRPQRKGVE